jgi:cephalosporin hydroxylase
MENEIALDKEIILEYMRFLLDHDIQDSPQSRKQFCDETSRLPKLLYYNPYIKVISSLFVEKSNFERLKDMSIYDWMLYHRYYVHEAYRFGDTELQQKWLGHNILKSPFDCWIYQEIIYRVRPDFILELGVMFGGASHFYASICDMIGKGTVIGVDISFDKVKSIDNNRIHYIKGSSTSHEVFDQVRDLVEGKSVMVIADSNHEKNHVLEELHLYSPFIPKGSYYIVEDTLNDVMHWHPVPNEGPQEAVREFLVENSSFVPDIRYAEKYIMTLNPLGYLLRIK